MKSVKSVKYFTFFLAQLRFETEVSTPPPIARDLCDNVNDDGGLDWIGGGAPK